MLVLERKNDEVFYNNRKLAIIKQESKGAGKEVVKISGLEGSNGQKFYSLSKLKQGLNECECKAKDTSNMSQFAYTEEEKTELNELNARINEIKAQARERYEAKPKMPKLDDIANMSLEDKERHIANLRKYLGFEA